MTGHRLRRRWRWVAWPLGLLVALAAIGYGLDSAARAGAEALVARDIEHGRPAPAHADVDLMSTFFLPDVVAGRYPHVHVRLDDITSEGLTVSRIDADLYDVTVPLGEVVHQTVTAIPVRRSRERALITYSELNAYLHARGQPMTVSKGHGDTLRLDAHLSSFGLPTTVSADATVTPGRDYIDVEPTRLDTGSGIVDAASAVLLKVRLAFRVTMSPLPFGQQVQAIRPTDQGLLVTATGQDVVIFPQRTSG